eukprot:tig00001374_g8501.t1
MQRATHGLFFGESVALSPFAQAFPRAAAFRVFAVEKQSEQQAPEQPAEQAGQQELDPPKPLRKLYPPAEDNLMNKVFWVQAIITAALGFVLAAELVPQFKGDPFWGIMGGWSMWMFVIPSVQARRPTHQARWAINWSFALIPLINVVVPFVYKSFLAVYLTDVIFFLAMYWYGHNGKQFPEDQYVPSDEYLLWLEQTEQFDKLEKYCSDA